MPRSRKPEYLATWQGVLKLLEAELGPDEYRQIVGPDYPELGALHSVLFDKPGKDSGKQVAKNKPRDWFYVTLVSFRCRGVPESERAAALKTELRKIIDRERAADEQDKQAQRRLPHYSDADTYIKKLRTYQPVFEAKRKARMPSFPRALPPPTPPPAPLPSLLGLGLLDRLTPPERAALAHAAELDRFDTDGLLPQ